MNEFVALKREFVDEWRSGRLLTPTERVYIPASSIAAANIGLDRSFPEDRGKIVEHMK